MNIVKIPLSSIHWLEPYIIFNNKIKLLIEKRKDNIYETVSIDGYPTAQYINYKAYFPNANTMKDGELEIGYL